jgi:CRP-like cAMP-binding protein
VKRYDNAPVFTAADRSDGIYAHLAGQVAVMRVLASGRLADLRYIRPGHWFGISAALDGKPHGYDVFAFGKAAVLHLPSDGLSRIVAGDAERLLHFVRLLCSHYRLAMDHIATARSQTAIGQLAQQLLLLSSTHGEPEGDGTRIDLKLSQEKLAAMIGVGRQTLNRHLKRLEAEGAVSLGYASITVRRAALLAHVAAPEP